MAGSELIRILYFKTLPKSVPEGHMPASCPAFGATAAEPPRWQHLCELQHAAEGPAPSASQGKCHRSRSQRLSQHTFTHPPTSTRGSSLGGATGSHCAHLTESCPCINSLRAAHVQTSRKSHRRSVRSPLGSGTFLHV